MNALHLIKVPDFLAASSLVFCEGQHEPAELVEIIDTLKGDLLDINEQVNNIQAKADGEQRELTEDEATEIDRLFAQFEKVETEIGRRERILEQAKSLARPSGRKTESDENDPTPQAAARRKAPAQPRSEDRGKWGWRSFGEFANSVRSASQHGGRVDPRLVANAPTTYTQEGIGEDGGFLVPPDFRQEIMTKVMGEDSLLGRTDQLTTGSNSVVLPTDETTPWDSSGGIQAYWGNEASQLSQSKVKLGEKQLRLHKLTALIPVTEEMQADAGTLDGYLRRKVPEKFDYKIQNAIVNGTGAGQPLGILQSPALVSVAKDTNISPSQQADTVLYSNIVNMYARMYAPCRSRAVWLINQDIEPQLYTMAFDPNNQTKVPVYLPAGSVAGSPFGTLFGRPVLPIESCSTLGDKGDIIFADLTQYLTVLKTGGIRQDISMHLFFDYDTMAYRFIFRVAGMPWWGAPITPANGNNTRSCFVTLDERA